VVWSGAARRDRTGPRRTALLWSWSGSL